MKDKHKVQILFPTVIRTDAMHTLSADSPNRDGRLWICDFGLELLPLLEHKATCDSRPAASYSRAKNRLPENGINLSRLPQLLSLPSQAYHRRKRSSEEADS